MKKISDMNAQEWATTMVRIWAADMVQTANSGHPGFPLGIADVAVTLFDRFLRFDPTWPEWPGRDRFILSPGHGSALLYALLHFYGYDLSVDQLKKFRQLGSMTPGHPEHGMTPGVETTTGPLGQGLGNAVGMALASKLLHERLKGEVNGKMFSPADYRVYCIVGDGCLMEGVSSEVASIAGHLGLDNLVVIHDYNRVTIDGSTDLTFTEDIEGRFMSLGWNTRSIDGHAIGQICEALEIDGSNDTRPTFIRARTKIGYRSEKEGTSKAHGEPLGVEVLKKMKQGYGWPEDEMFHVPPCGIKAFFSTRIRDQKLKREKWDETYKAWVEKFPDKKDLWHRLGCRPTEDKLLKDMIAAVGKDKAATRVHSGNMIQTAAPNIPSLISGSADLTGSNKTWIDVSTLIAPEKFGGRNIAYGVREHGMAVIMNGLSLSGKIIPVGGTFLVFSDYMIPGIRMAAMMGLHVIYVFTHDSIYLGEDGPTHQPEAHIGKLRLTYGLNVWRPADGLETAVAWTSAAYRNHPAALCLTRQSVPVLKRPEGFKDEDALRGGYVILEATKRPDHVLIATGSEVALAIEIGKELGCRVVSMPCQEMFDRQPEKWRHQIIPKEAKVAAIEASVDYSWLKYTGKEGPVIGVGGYGASAPASELADYFGFTPEKVLKKLEDWAKI